MQYYMRECDPPLLIASGRTTRLADGYVQRLFQFPGEWIDIEDHAEYFVGHKATDLLINIIHRRMLVEHDIRIERKFNSHYIRIPLDKAKQLIEFRDGQHKAQKIWHESLKL